MKWGWVFRCIVIVFILSGINIFILNRVYDVPANQEGQAASSGIFLSWLLVIFFGSLITALLSPGKTITEPAIACAFIVIFSQLSIGNSSGTLFDWILPYFLGLAGARLGEWVSAKVVNRRHVQKQ